MPIAARRLPALKEIGHAYRGHQRVPQVMVAKVDSGITGNSPGEEVICILENALERDGAFLRKHSREFSDNQRRDLAGIVKIDRGKRGQGGLAEGQVNLFARANAVRICTQMLNFWSIFVSLMSSEVGSR